MKTSWYSPAHIPPNIFNLPRKKKRVRILNIQVRVIYLERSNLFYASLFPFFAVTTFYWISFPSSAFVIAFVIAQCPSLRYFQSNLTQHRHRLTANIVVCNVTRPMIDIKNSSGWMVQESLQNYSALRIFLPLSHSSLSDKTTVWRLHVNWPISIFKNSAQMNNRLQLEPLENKL